MKLVKQDSRGCQYQLSSQEAKSLRLLVDQFPVAEQLPVKISKSDPEALEREKLLNESLADHREKLKQQSAALVEPGKFKTSGKHQVFRISQEKREVMLQILNDIRVESWRALGEPEDLENCAVNLPQDKFKYYYFMYQAGYFQYHFLNVEGQAGEN
ncbi:MAG TPA: hypothetical protein VMH87_14145 [Pseudomonadales bacterium]|nr:hypothetical protein [Pseudomonadales bacterium]